jgi:hypothetical protein
LYDEIIFFKFYSWLQNLLVESGSKFSYSGIVIVRKMNDGKSSEFNFSIEKFKFIVELYVSE